MPAMIFSFLGSRLGGYAVAAAIAVSLGLTIYVQHLIIETRDARIGKLTSDLGMAVSVNGNQAKLIDSLTSQAASAKRRATEAANDLAAAQAETRTETVTIIKEIERAATVDDHAPVTPGLRAALARVRERFTNGH